ncbi:molybdopterin molybdenumtransferase MoeA [bacterium]|nr:molybdopterin molybdenumtransferase MoeA [bacterium]
MLPYQSALKVILELPFEAAVETLPLLSCHGRFLAEPPHAPFDQPRFDNSAMDGFAARARDLVGATAGTPVVLPVVGESAAGRAYVGTVPPASAIRISTGAPVPAELDAIVPVENAAVHGDRVSFSAPAKPGLYRRVQGSDIAEGSSLLQRGRRLDSAAIALLSSFNITHVTVYRRPRVGILTSGDEIKTLGESLGPDDIVGSSLYYLENELRQCGCEPRLFGVARDDAEDYARRFGEMLEWSDLLITTAGVSVGTHDVVGDVIGRFGGQVHFWKVAVRPGKPMLVASYGAKHHFGFPGNPVSTCCNTEIFLKPFLRKAFGHSTPITATRRMALGAECPRDAARLFFVYAKQEVDPEGRMTVVPLPNQNSGNLSLCASADALIISEPGSPPIPVGQEVPVHLIKEGL